ncbi:MAG: hypothetical protein KDB21_01695 [Acidimicrobiales bacterium]|nr:hypothetical protein [Acidimicrobiales bacterium]
MDGGFDPRLGRVCNFDELDLSANRSGQLSADQRTMLSNVVRIGGRRSTRMWWLFVALVIAALVAAAIGSDALDAPGDAAAPLAVAGGVLFALVLLVALFRRRDRSRRSVMAAGVVATVTGPWELDTSLDGTWRIRVDGRLIAAERLLVDTLDDKGVYRCYLLDLPGVAALLSIERVG